MKLIDADALIERIKKRKNDFEDYKSHFKRFNSHLIPDVEAKIEEDDYMLSFIDSMKEESVSEDLEKESKIIAEKLFDEFFPQDGDLLDLTEFSNGIEKVARHFANWQKQQMMEDAITATILPANLEETEFCLDDYDEVKHITRLVKEENLKIGDKVKVIIVKEE